MDILRKLEIVAQKITTWAVGMPGELINANIPVPTRL